MPKDKTALMETIPSSCISTLAFSTVAIYGFDKNANRGKVEERFTVWGKAMITIWSLVGKGCRNLGEDCGIVLLRES